MGQSDNIPGNIIPPDYQAEAHALLAILIAVFVIAIILYFVRCIIDNKKIKRLQELQQNKLTDNEIKLILKYRALNDKSKSAVNEALLKETL